MAVVVLLLGILAAGAGLAAIGFAVPNIGTDFGNTLIVAGATGLTGGLILFGLAVAVGQLTRIAEGLRARTRPVRSPEAPLPPRSETLQPRTEPIPPRAEPVVPLPDMVPYTPRAAPEPRLSGTPSDLSSSAIERLRSALPRPDRLVPEAEEDVPLSPDVSATPQQADETPEPMAPVTRPGSEEGTPQRQQRLDFLFRSRAAPPSAPPPSATPAPEERSNPFESMWPKRATRRRDMLPSTDDAESNAAPPLATEPAPPEPRRIAPEPPAAPVTEETPSAAILKSGVVDGMAYTLYADGSIEAQLPQGTMRFASITELRAHIDTNS